jgi:hypothetical protein
MQQKLAALRPNSSQVTQQQQQQQQQQQGSWQHPSSDHSLVRS